MKKWFILLLAGAMVVAFTVPASAIDVQNTIGGYWRTRAFLNHRFSGDDTKSKDLTRTDTRTRLYLFSKFSDQFRFVNRFEFDAVWGEEGGGYGRIGADGVKVEVKNSYAEWKQNGFELSVGVQGYSPGTNFLFDDDCASVIVAYNAEIAKIEGFWIKAYEGGIGVNKNDEDVDYYGLTPTFKISDMLSINPFFMYAFSDNASSYSATPGIDDLNLWYLGANVSAKIAGASVWGTGIYNGGDLDMVGGGTIDRSAFLLAAGASLMIGPVGVNAEGFWASGDDDPNDNDDNAFSVPKGDSHYWAEIMGQGTFDAQSSNNSPANHPSNIYAVKIGGTYNILDTLKGSVDLWYAGAPESVDNRDSYGTEIDGKLTYKVMPGLNLDLIAAYLFAGDLTENPPDSADPYELGARLSLSF